MKRTLIAGAATMLLAACGGAADAPGKTVQQFMAEDVQPTADIYWGAVRFESVLVDGQPVERDIRPETDEDWARVREAAAKLGRTVSAIAQSLLELEMAGWVKALPGARYVRVR